MGTFQVYGFCRSQEQHKVQQVHNVRRREEQCEEDRDVLQNVLVATLDAVERLCVLVVLVGIHLQHTRFRATCNKTTSYCIVCFETHLRVVDAIVFASSTD